MNPRLAIFLAGMMLAIIWPGCGDSSDQGDGLKDKWQGYITCRVYDSEGNESSYSVSFNLDGKGNVTDVSIGLSIPSLPCPGGPGEISCGGKGTYTYEVSNSSQQTGNNFHMEIQYSDCKCGGSPMDLLSKDIFDGAFDEPGYLKGTVGSCQFSFQRPLSV